MAKDTIGASPLNPETMLSASTARTGLADFGDDGFRDGLNRLLAEVSDLNLDAHCIAASAGRIGQALDARALAVAGIKSNPSVHDREIQRPLIIAGLVRSGTTALHQLLSLDTQFQGPEHWLTVAPMPRPPRDQWDEVDAYRQVRDALALLVEQAPEMADDHMMTAEGIEESLFILSSSFASNMWPSMWPVPNYDRWYRSRNDVDSYRWLADVLRLIGRDDKRRWLLKNPTDLFSLDDVLAVFPDAMIVQTHRDPVKAMPSICSLILAAQRIFVGDKADPLTVGARESQLWAEAVERAHAVRSRHDARQFIDIEFVDFVGDQLGQIERIYEHFDLDLSAETRDLMQKWLNDHPRRKVSGSRYRPEDYGLTEQGLKDQFRPYRARQGYGE